MEGIYFQEIKNREDGLAAIKFLQEWENGSPCSPDYYLEKDKKGIIGYHEGDIVLASTLHLIGEQHPISIRFPNGILLTDLLVHPDFRGRGVPNRFIEWIRDEFPERDTLIANPRNDRIRAWAKRMGFQDQIKGSGLKRAI